MTTGLTHPLSYWEANDIVLAYGQRGVISDLGYWKVGDGNNPFSGLPLKGLGAVNAWFSEWGQKFNDAGLLCTIYHQWLIGGSLVQQGNWADFEFNIDVANNANSKTIYVKFANQVLATINPSASTGQSVLIRGKIKCQDYNNKEAYFCISYTQISYGVVSGNSIFSGVLSGINWNANNALIVQFQGVATNDLIGNGGDGRVCLIPRY